MELFAVGLVVAAFFVWLVLTIPLWVSVRMLGSDAGLLWTAVVGFVMVVLQVLAKIYVAQSYGVIAGFAAAYLTQVLVIMGAFGLSFVRAVIATVLPFFLVAGLVFLTGASAYLLYAG